MWKKINSSFFRWDNSVRANQISMADIFDSDDDDFSVLKEGIKLIGYCNATELPVLSNPDGYGVMMEFPDGELYWMHNWVKVRESKSK